MDQFGLNLLRTPSPTGFSVGASAVQLSGYSPSGYTLLNASAGSQTIYIGNQGVLAVSTGANAGFPLAAGAAIDRSRIQDLSQVWAIASSSGAILSVIPL